MSNMAFQIGGSACHGTTYSIQPRLEYEEQQLVLQSYTKKLSNELSDCKMLIQTYVLIIQVLLQEVTVLKSDKRSDLGDLLKKVHRDLSRIS